MTPYPRSAYLAGPMRGIPRFNFPAFDEAAADLRGRGIDVYNPAERDAAGGFDAATGAGLKTIAEYMAKDLPVVCEKDAVVVLPGWHKSQGARIEVMVAHALGKPVLRYPNLTPTRHPSSQRFHDLLEESGRLHDRKQADYGTDGDPFANVRSTEEWGVPAWVGAMVRLNDKVVRLKSMARRGSLLNESAEDSMRDISVYALIALVLYEEEQARLHTPDEVVESLHAR